MGRSKEKGGDWLRLLSSNGAGTAELGQVAPGPLCPGGQDVVGCLAALLQHPGNVQWQCCCPPSCLFHSWNDD